MSKTALRKFIPLVACFVLPQGKPIVAVETPTQSSPRPHAETEWKLLWQDEFSSDQLDTEKWSRCRRGRPAWRDTMSDDPRLLQIKDGVLHLRGVVNDKQGKPDDPAPYLTAGITSRDKFSFQYGKVQIRARFKSAQGAWPALWMMGTEKGWRAKGEIDLMEHLNFDHHVYQTVHSTYTLIIDRTNTPKRYIKAKIDRDDWNTYGCQWDANQIVFSVNGKPTHTYPRFPAKGEKQWPFDQPFYMILSVQIGGSWVNGSGPTDPAHYPAGMEIDWVRIFRANQS
jgi:beta-glucanase (GH16 family)